MKTKIKRDELLLKKDLAITEIIGLSYSAAGVARYEGKVIFIPYTVTGDIVSFSVVKDKKTFADGKLEEVLKSSPYRRPAPCPYFGRCGGCQWQHVVYTYQLFAKKNITKDLLERIGSIEVDNISDTHWAQGEWHYRQRVRFQIGHSNGKTSFGFAIYGSNNVVDIEYCHIVQKPIAELIRHLASKKDVLKDFYEFEVYSSDDGTFIFYATAREQWDKSAIDEVMPYFKGGIIREKRSNKVYNIREPNLTYTVKCSVGDYRVKVQAGGFIQSNPYVNELIVNTIVDELSHCNDKILLELYAGAGNFSIPLSRIFKHVIAVEGDPFSFHSLEENIPKNGIINVTAVKSDVYDEVVRYFNKKRQFDVIFLDPPRIGAKEIMPFLPKFNPSKIVYLSCNPSTLARDLKILYGGGYRLKKLIPFDMFPQTFHIETLAVLEKGL